MNISRYLHVYFYINTMSFFQAVPTNYIVFFFGGYYIFVDPYTIMYLCVGGSKLISCKVLHS